MDAADPGQGAPAPRPDPDAATAVDKPQRRRGWRRGVGVALVATLATVGYLWWTAAPDHKVAKDKPVDVAVARSQAIALPMVFEASGHVVPLNSVEMRALIDGVVRRVGFTEGQTVQAGQLLFELEVDDIVAELAHARADLMRIAAEVEDAQANLERGRNLVASSYISSSALDALVARRKSLRAQMQAATATAQGAEARLARATIRAPMDARAGMAAIREGARVRQADAEPLVVLHQFDPIGVEFTLPERLLPTIVEAAARAPVQLEAVTEGGQVVQGELAVVDNVIDRSTGTIRLRAELGNAHEVLWPGAFVRARLRIDTPALSVVVPPQAVVEGPEGTFVYRVQPDDTVTAHPVQVLRIQEGLAVLEGLEGGQEIVVEGMRFLRDGAQVRTQPHATTLAGAADAGPAAP